jgi:uncharacterized protein (TIGR02996 family)
MSDDTLLAAIHADPDDDEPRRVYADLLLERGDPRGELIVLQLARAAGDATEAQVQRERALLNRHARAWLGPLVEVCELGGGLSGAWARGRTRFERGFVATAYLNRTADPAVIGHPLWETVTDLRGSFAAHTAMIAGTRLGALRRFHGSELFTAAQLRVLATRTTPLHVEAVPLFAGDEPPPDLSRACVGADAAITIPIAWRGDLATLADIGLPTATLSVHLAQTDEIVAALRARPARFERVVVSTHHHSRYHYGDRYRTELVRGPDGRYG